MSARLNENKLWSVHDLADFLGVPVPTVRVPTTRYDSGRRYKARFVGPRAFAGVAYQWGQLAGARFESSQRADVWSSPSRYARPWTRL